MRRLFPGRGRCKGEGRNVIHSADSPKVVRVDSVQYGGRHGAGVL